MYGKLFDTMYDGTLAEDWRALVTFQQMIILCDADGIIDLTPTAIARRTGIPIEHIEAGIKILENSDPYSRTKNDEGRRIKLLDEHSPWGWYIVNHEKYKSLQDSDTVREQNRERKRKQREREKASRPVTDCHGHSRYTDTNTDIIKPLRKCADLFALFWAYYPKKKSKGDAEKAFKAIKADEQLLATMIAKIGQAKKSPEWLKDGGQFIPYPATWLRAKGWEDEVAQPQPDPRCI